MKNENELATIAVDICYKIHTELGPGLLESIYEAAFKHELRKENLKFTSQQVIPVVYKTENLGLGFRSDIIIENKLLVELKSVEKTERVHHKITLTYLKLTEIKLGLLVNFNVEFIRDGIHRKINGEL